MSTLPTFMGYATCFNLQRYIKESLYVKSSVFSVAYGFLYMGNLLFRFFHNYIWVFTSPFWRVIISYIGIIILESLQIVAVLVKWNPQSNNSWLAFLIYFVGGVSIGTVESNILNVVAQISHKARQYAVLGIPIGCNFITIFSFLFIEAAKQAGTLSEHQVCAVLFGVTIGLEAASLAMLCAFVPHGPFLVRKAPLRGAAADAAVGQHSRRVHDDSDSSVSSSSSRLSGDELINEKEEGMKVEKTSEVGYMWQAFKKWREWLWQILPNSVGMMGNMFAVAQFSPGVTLYTISNGGTVRFFGGRIGAGYFRCVQGVFSLGGDVVARLAFERVGYVFPPALLLVSLLGVLLVVSGVPELLCLASLLIMLINGTMYIQTSKWIREITAHNHWGLAAYSFWLFVGDFGSLIASFTQQQIATSLCTDLRNKVYNGYPGQWDPCPYYQ